MDIGQWVADLPKEGDGLIIALGSVRPHSCEPPCLPQLREPDRLIPWLIAAIPDVNRKRAEYAEAVLSHISGLQFTDVALRDRQAKWAEWWLRSKKPE
jgi:hypothetical protein